MKLIFSSVAFLLLTACSLKTYGPKVNSRKYDGIFMQTIQLVPTSQLNKDIDSSGLTNVIVANLDSTYFYRSQSISLPADLFRVDPYFCTKSVKLEKADKREFQKRLKDKDSYEAAVLSNEPVYSVRFLKFRNLKMIWEIDISLETKQLEVRFPTLLSEGKVPLIKDERRFKNKETAISEQMKTYLLDLLKRYEVYVN